METETDYQPVEKPLRGQIVGYRACKKCGKFFTKDPQHPKRTVCPQCRSQANKMDQAQITKASFNEMKRCEAIEAEKRAERIRKRDEAYARWERANGVQPTYRVNGNQIIESRGHVCMGFRAASSVQHN